MPNHFETLYAANAQNIVTLFETPLITYKENVGYQYTLTESIGQHDSLACVFVENAWECAWETLALYNIQPHPTILPGKHNLSLFTTLNQQFWDHTRNEQLSSVVYVIGHVGVGKTTALQHYFISFCRNFHPETYDRKCPVYIDLFEVDVSDIKRTIYACIRNAVTAWYKGAAHPSLLRKAHTDNRSRVSYLKNRSHLFLRANSEYADETLDSMSSEERDGHTMALLERVTDDQHWWSMFARYFNLCPQNDSSTGDLDYLVIVVDNVDQKGYSALDEALKVIRQILKQTKRIWRVYISAWESLFEHLKANPDPHLRGDVVHIKDAKVFAVLAARTDKLKMQTWRGCKDKGRDGEERVEDGIVAHLIYQTTALALLRSIPRHNIYPNWDRRPWYAALAGGTLRMALGLTASAMQAPSIEILVRREVRERDYHHDVKDITSFVFLLRCARIAKDIRRYALVDSLLCGSSGEFSNNHRYIPNVIHLGDELKDTINPVLGVNLCDAVVYLQRRSSSPTGAVMSLKALREEMISRRFANHEVILAYDVFMAKRILQPCSGDASLFVAMPDRALALRDIVWDSAFLDNVSQIQFRSFKPYKTVSTENGMFFMRVLNTLNFIEYFDEIEDGTGVLSKVNGNEVYISKLMLDSFDKRMRALKTGWVRGKWLKEVSSAEWASIIDRIESLRQKMTERPLRLYR